jgi:hypothetical protein
MAKRQLLILILYLGMRTSDVIALYFALVSAQTSKGEKKKKNRDRNLILLARF